MKRINVDLFELQAFARLAELRSFRAAAEDLGLSSSALSRLVARVEDKLRARLFDRDTRNVALTPQGETLQHLTGRILNEAAAALTEFDAHLAARRGRVALAGLPSVTASLLPLLVARFAADHPDVEISIIDALSDGVMAAVLEGRADLGFTAGALDGSGRLSFRPLLEEQLRSHRLSRWAACRGSGLCLAGIHRAAIHRNGARYKRARLNGCPLVPKLDWPCGRGSRWRI